MELSPLVGPYARDRKGLKVQNTERVNVNVGGDKKVEWM